MLELMLTAIRVNYEMFAAACMPQYCDVTEVCQILRWQALCYSTTM